MNSIKLISLAALATSLMPSWAAQKSKQAEHYLCYIR